MTSNNMNPKVDEFLSQSEKWKQEYGMLRDIILDCNLNEELKWGKPCYTFQEKNIVLIHGFKEYCALLFHKGALLKDAQGILIQQTENVQAARQIRFTNVQDIVDRKNIVKDYINEAIAVEKAGLEVEFKKKEEIPGELERKFDEIPDLKAAFEALTPGRQRAYILYFSKAKKTTTRESRIEKYVQHIFNGKGLND
ncbi:YdeI/OmpD-associated family protein [Halobacillus sp. H74]|uniref:YdeI/OmpD-associated family protein n=1 Tax=Halobacillus sp. H74 TaxID=3457436 RepID=UPI003FCD8456